MNLGPSGHRAWAFNPLDAALAEEKTEAGGNDCWSELGVTQRGWEWNEILCSLESLKFNGEDGHNVVPKDWGRILLRKQRSPHQPPGFSFLTSGMQ